MSCSNINPGCLFFLQGECVSYSGSRIPLLNILPKDNLNVIVNKINTFLLSGYIFNVEGIVTETYADMIALATGNQYKRFLVKNDENKGIPNTTYEYYPGVALMWIASTTEIDLT